MDLAGYVADMSLTCRRHATMSADSAQHGMSTRHRMGSDRAFMCRKLPTLCFLTSNEVWAMMDEAAVSG